jgi:hypothetical protein
MSLLAPRLKKVLQVARGGTMPSTTVQQKLLHLYQPNFLGLKPKINVPVSLV